MSWFERLTGVPERSPAYVRQHLVHKGETIQSRANGKSWRCGRLEMPNLQELRDRKHGHPASGRPSVREVVADAGALHCERLNAGAMFQVASQFNLLEMTGPNVTPEAGIGIYENDPTQGPACAIAAGAGTIYRNYFVEQNGEPGQTRTQQLDCLRELASRLSHGGPPPWEMRNGYLLPTPGALEGMHVQLQDETERDQLRSLVRIGLQLDTQVTQNDASHLVSQAYCAAAPISYARAALDAWRPLATLLLEAAYEATLLAATEQVAREGSPRLYLTLLGGGAFGNPEPWIVEAAYRAITLNPDSGLDIAIVSFGRSNPAVQQLVVRCNSVFGN